MLDGPYEQQKAFMDNNVASDLTGIFRYSSWSAKCSGVTLAKDLMAIIENIDGGEGYYALLKCMLILKVIGLWCMATCQNGHCYTIPFWCSLLWPEVTELELT
ncbi:hypothetical protein C1646_756036 [Rhizophagus diaphanus]|nr:hypothetical protein C1646_756036 [Rhizophagus diaphanus] [Rhizophagus sp. MUCL 43196]